jgi:hypothetical protein
MTSLTFYMVLYLSIALLYRVLLDFSSTRNIIRAGGNDRQAMTKMSDILSEYKTVSEIARAWNVTNRTVIVYIREKRISGAVKKGRIWLIPSSAQKPEDRRKNNRRRPKKEDAARDKRNGSARVHGKPPGEV